jgi:hypothetical protein
VSLALLMLLTESLINASSLSRIKTLQKEQFFIMSSSLKAEIPTIKKRFLTV